MKHMSEKFDQNMDLICVDEADEITLKELPTNFRIHRRVALDSVDLGNMGGRLRLDLVVMSIIITTAYMLLV